MEINELRLRSCRGWPLSVESGQKRNRDQTNGGYSNDCRVAVGVGLQFIGTALLIWTLLLTCHMSAERRSFGGPARQSITP
jgi:hypothetical protein